MHIKDLVTNNGYTLTKNSGYVLNLQHYHPRTGTNTCSDYDFVARLLTVNVGRGDGGQSSIPFSQLDPEALHFYRKELIKLGGTPPELPDDIVDPSAPATELWVGLGDNSIAHVAVFPPLQKKITRIFNFESRQLQNSTENLRTHNEVFSPAVSFENLPDATLEQALERFAQFGKTPDRAFVFRGVTRVK